ncbi:MAG: KOW domain-containing RNA-binding protein [Clostridia bacterium]|nr:KOW domain-containing RNA-binding protein [Clostridia bacterium]
MKIRVVSVKAGRDKNKLMAVVDETEKSMLLCDGKERPLERPKRKNIKHIAPTDYEINREDLHSNRSLRKALHECSKHS